LETPEPVLVVSNVFENAILNNDNEY